MIRIIIADDHQMFIDGLNSLLQSNTNVQVVGSVANGIELIEMLSETPADLVIMDVNMEQMNGIEATKVVKQKYPHIKVLAVTMFSSREYIEKMLRAGVDGYILKNTGKDELNEAVAAIMRGESYFNKAVTEKIMQSMQGRKEAANDPLLIELTPREKDVLKLIVEEMTSHEIADKLCISFHTVETHRKNLISKLQVKNIAGLVRFALEHGLVD